MQTKHTAEPWHSTQVRTAIANGCVVANFNNGELDHMEQDANCERAISCVNACAGLEPSAIAGVIEAAKLGLSALEKLMGDTDLDNDDSIEMRACKALSAALAKLGGDK